MLPPMFNLRGIAGSPLAGQKLAELSATAFGMLSWRDIPDPVPIR
ncbi:hypothetical protein [Aquipseudomonas ullengensis]|nr:hypothetical protein [Pseudomonas ullengensis]